MKEILLGISLLSALVLAPVGVNLQEVSATVASNTIHPMFEEYILYYEQYQDFYEEYEEYNEQDEYEEDRPLLFRTTARLNLRQGPGTGYNRIITTAVGQIVTVIDERDGEWFAVDVNGITGYMYSYFLTEVPEAEIPENNDTEVTLSLTNGPVERVTWSYARNFITTGTPLTIVDVRTGITWQMATFSHGNHADSEPITAADTAAMLRAFGGRWCWQPRPIHVHVGGRVFAASINGMPHAGSTNHNNNMNGHVCIHFYGSRTHNGNRSHERDHQNAVNEAFNTAR